jgi:hypothetical protein
MCSVAPRDELECKIHKAWTYTCGPTYPRLGTTAGELAVWWGLLVRRRSSPMVKGDWRGNGELVVGDSVTTVGLTLTGVERNGIKS